MTLNSYIHFGNSYSDTCKTANECSSLYCLEGNVSQSMNIIEKLLDLTFKNTNVVTHS